MTAGALDHRLQFLRGAASDDGMSAAVLSFANHGAPVWGSRRDVSDGERWQAGAMQAQVTARFVVRWSAFAAAITPKDRVRCEGDTYEIAGIKVIGRREFVEITASARVPN